MTTQFAVSGKVTLPNGPFPDVTERAFNKDRPRLSPRREQQLGADAAIDLDGSYVLSFTQRDFHKGASNGQGKLRPDLFTRAWDVVLGQSAINFKAAPETSIDLKVAIPHCSEFEAIVHALAPSLHGASIIALTYEDIGFLVRRNRSWREAARGSVVQEQGCNFHRPSSTEQKHPGARSCVAAFR
jgi:hypothetical protein